MRFEALKMVNNRQALGIFSPSKLSELYGKNVFGYEKMKVYLAKEAYQAIEKSIRRGIALDRIHADQIAAGMKQWALEMGCTHYTHWFQPLTGSTAEKHDAFFEPSEGDRAIEKFSGNALVQQEPDASSFPNGGLRNTFEARGYTAWDPSSPAFVMEYPSGKTLCIPTVFVSYTGEALDFKAPLLKALHQLEEATVAVCQSFFDRNVKKATASLGIEQEYFLVDEALFNARQDLMISGRTLVGHPPAKGQQLEDHYFGSIPERIHSYMVDMECEAIKLGIPLKTRHNEVAPGQFECAPMYEEVNLAIDHNQLLMDLMEKIARKHNLRVLFHEKPFAGVNGSGKHNNWSITTDTGENLLSPGHTPKNNLQFLTFFINVIKAVHDHADLMRASIASAANDHRLGANEAPPAIMSVFIGSQLTKVLNEFKKEVTSQIGRPRKEGDNKINIKKIPEILVDNTDRNRTSPFAFTGNKFEFRAVGSSANSASAMIVMNTIMADQLLQFKDEVDKLIKAGEPEKLAIVTILKKYLKSSKRILFEGNGYGDEWVAEALERGLSNVKTTPNALDAYISKQSKKLFVNNGIFTERELEARHEIMLETYVKKIQIESRVIGEMATTQIIPAAVSYQTRLGQNVSTLINAGLKKDMYATQLEMVTEISNHINTIKQAVDQMIEERKLANNIENMHQRANAYCDKVKPYFDTIRYHSDKLELAIEDGLWPLPKYREILFLK
jgi:glutamine synthetase